ncbi:MAG: hypothetical protein K6F57_00010 [Candidatus Saccharibacteria bacterium]|nr:hypothetical protein [Candidatus Saccharibacteria bacterium]
MGRNGYTTKNAKSAIMIGDVEALEKIFDFYEINDEATTIWLSRYAFISASLNYAAAVAYNGEGSYKITEMLIERCSHFINVFSFTDLMMTALDLYERDGYDEIPEDIQNAMRKNEFSDTVASAIAQLDANEAEALLVFATEELEQLKREFTFPIIRMVYDNEMIDNHMLLSFMAASIEIQLNDRHA